MYKYAAGGRRRGVGTTRENDRKFFPIRVLGLPTEIKLTGIFEVRFYTIEWGRRRVGEGRGGEKKNRPLEFEGVCIQ